MTTQQKKLTVRDLTTDQEVRWCPGCGDFAILAQLKNTLASLGIPRERFVFISGIGCSSRLPYYLRTYGFHTIHGRAPTIATGLKLMRPELSVWVITGDGDGLLAGSNHLIHAIRRNVDIKILLFNNETLGLTRGQHSPTSREDTPSRSSPYGSFEQPLRGTSLALAAGATFVARTIDVDTEHLGETLRRAADHRGTAFVEIYQNCKIFNDGVFDYATEKGAKGDSVLYLRDGEPLIFGKDNSKGVRLVEGEPEAIRLRVSDPTPLLVHDEEGPLERAFTLSRLGDGILPECFGIIRCIQQPTCDEAMQSRTQTAIQEHGKGSLEKLFEGDDVWTVEDSPKQ